jgi:hypothetical protein
LRRLVGTVLLGTLSSLMPCTCCAHARRPSLVGSEVDVDFRCPAKIDI